MARAKTYSIFVFIGICVGFLGGILAGRVLFQPGGETSSLMGPEFMSISGYINTMEQANKFERLVAIIKSYLIKNDGYIPSDPYRALIDSGELEAFSDFFIGGDIVRFEVLTLPARINPDISKNPKEILFYVERHSLGEVWICYFDGSWERESDLGTTNERGLSSHGESLRRWYLKFHQAGYPYWISVSEKDKWIQKYRDNLKWDQGLRMYVVVPAENSVSLPKTPSGQN